MKKGRDGEEREKLGDDMNMDLREKRKGKGRNEQEREERGRKV